MRATNNPFSWLSRSILSVVLAVAAACAIAGSAEARQWIIEGRPVDAVFLDFNGHQVLLGTADGEQHIVYLQQLGDDDAATTARLPRTLPGTSFPTPAF